MLRTSTCYFHFQEVTLRRSSSNEKLGLTLCYGAPDDADTDIYVSEVIISAASSSISSSSSFIMPGSLVKF